MVDVLIQSFNEEKNLPHTLASIAGWTARIFVVDSGSTDRTAEIAGDFGAKVVHHDWEGYARQKNWALDNLPFASEWILILDADEAVSPELRDEILALAARPPDSVPQAGFFINRVFVFMGRKIWHCGYFPSWNLRLFKRGRARYEDRSVHEHMMCDGKVGKLRNLLIHEDRRGLEHFFAKHNRYSSLEARELFENPEPWPGLKELAGSPLKRRRFLKSRVLTKLPLVWLWRFIYMYVLRGGFLDGRAGWLLSNFISAYEFSIHIKYRELLMRDGAAGREPEALAQPEGALGADLPDFAPRSSRLALARMSGRTQGRRAAALGRPVAEDRAADQIQVVVLHGGGGGEEAWFSPLPEGAELVPVAYLTVVNGWDAEARGDGEDVELRQPSGAAVSVRAAEAGRIDSSRPWTLVLAAGDRLEVDVWKEVCAFAARSADVGEASLLLRRKICRRGVCISSSGATLSDRPFLAPSSVVWQGASRGKIVRSRHRVAHHWEGSIESILSRELWHARRWALERSSPLVGDPSARDASWSRILLGPATQFLRLMLFEGALLGGRAAWSAAFIATSGTFVKRLLLREQFDPRLREAEAGEPIAAPTGTHRVEPPVAALAS